jgi:hypothetical protein
MRTLRVLHKHGTAQLYVHKASFCNNAHGVLRHMGGSMARRSEEDPIMTTPNNLTDYESFLRAKTAVASPAGTPISPERINPRLKPHQRLMVQWMVEMGRAACFASFGIGKTVMQLETCKILGERGHGDALIVAPLGVRGEFTRDAEMLGYQLTFIRTDEEYANTSEKTPGLYITNYESIRDGKLDPRQFTVTSLDEAAVLRGFGATKTFREFMRLFDGVQSKIVATATPSPNEFVELLAYSAYLEVMDVGQAKTRFFKRDSQKADRLTIHPHKKREFWLWVSSWALFVQHPRDLGCDAQGYDLPPLRRRGGKASDDNGLRSNAGNIAGG